MADEDRQAHGKAVKVIGGHKAQITRASAVLERVVTAGIVGPDDISTVRSAKTMVEKQMAKIEAQSDNLLGNDYFTEDALNELTDYLLDKGNLCEQVSTILDDSAGVKKGDATVLDTSGIGAALSESLLQMQLRHPVSASDLPKFNGESAEYIPFIESFNFLVHENDSIPDAMKATYLKRCMSEKGPDGKPNSAHDLIKHIIPTKENYKLMREKLESRFKVGYLNRVTYLANLRKLNTWKPCTTGTEIRKLYDYLTENLDLLELAGGNSVNESDILLSDVLSLIPKFIVNSFLLVPENERTLKRLLKEIDESASRMLEREVLVPKANPVYNKPRYTNNQNSNNNNRSNVYKPSFTYHGNQSLAKSGCLFCGKEHNSFTCNTGTAQERIGIAKDSRFCYNCLKVGHRTADCRFSSNCNCGIGRHCKALCLQVAQSNIGNSYHKTNSPVDQRGFVGQRGNGRGKFQSRGRGGNNSNVSPQNTNNLAVDSDVAMNILADTECFMELGRGFVKSNTSDDYQEARLFFDSASNGSYVRKDFVHGVKCEKVGMRDLDIDTFNGEVKKPNCDIVKFSVFDTNNCYEPTEMCASVVDEVCRDVPTWQLTSQQAKSIRQYQLSDPMQVSGKSVPITVLIGLDNYWKFMRRRIDDPGFGPKLRSNKLGWILSGQRDFSNPRLLTTISNNPLTLSLQTLFVNVGVSPDVSDKLELEPVVFANKLPQSEEEEYCSRFSDLETFGIKPEKEISPILEDFNNNISFNGETKRYQVGLQAWRQLWCKQG